MRRVVEEFEKQFVALEGKLESVRLRIDQLDDAVSSKQQMRIDLVRAAALIEQSFGGITTRLWDDPFEWTLPEQLNSSEGISEYFAEVTSARTNGFSFFSGDEDLIKKIPAPEKTKTIFDVLVTTLSSSYSQLTRVVVQLEGVATQNQDRSET